MPDAALVTGGGSGLGRAIVSRFVEEGARVVVLDRSKEKLDEVAGAFGDAVRTVAGDVTSVEDNEAAVAAAVVDFGGLDVLVGNAGIWDFNASLEATDAHRLPGGFDELFGVNDDDVWAREELEEFYRDGDGWSNERLFPPDMCIVEWRRLASAHGRGTQPPFSARR